MFNVRKRGDFARFLPFFIVYMEYYLYICNIRLKHCIMIFEFDLELLMKMHFGALLQLRDSLNDVIVEQKNVNNLAKRLNDVENITFSQEVIERAEANNVLINLAMEHLEDKVIVDTQIATFSLN